MDYKHELVIRGVNGERVSTLLGLTLDSAEWLAKMGLLGQEELEAFRAVWNIDPTKMTRADGSLKG